MQNEVAERSAAMRQLLRFLVPTLAASVLLAACGSSSSSTSNNSTATKAAAATPSAAVSVSLVKTASNSTLGKTVIVNAQGMTLYSLSGERAGKLICTSAACLKAWPPLIVKGGGAPKGSVGSLGTISRPGGLKQLTYKGMPVYTFVGDTKPGDAKGQGIKDEGSIWTADVSGAASSTAPAPAPAVSSSSSSGGGYSY
jgi:predicted lipoprotein with Yx(FWY)xxD motif